MRRALFLLSLPLAFGGCASGMQAGSTPAKTPVDASATLRAADGSPRGAATLSPTGGGFLLHVEANGLPSGEHGIHLHAVGRCDGPDFQTAGGHWNPTSRQHGRDNPQGAHQGDLPNIVIGADGRGTLDATISGATLNGLLDADGAALVVHANPDDYRTDPSGNSGGRIACGVIERR